MKYNLKIKNVINPYQIKESDMSNYFWYGWSGDNLHNLHLRNNQNIKPKVIRYFSKIWDKDKNKGKTWEELVKITIEKFSNL